MAYIFDPDIVHEKAAGCAGFNVASGSLAAHRQFVERFEAQHPAAGTHNRPRETQPKKTSATVDPA